MSVDQGSRGRVSIGLILAGGLMVLMGHRLGFSPWPSPRAARSR